MKLKDSQVIRIHSVGLLSSDHRPEMPGTGVRSFWSKQHADRLRWDGLPQSGVIGHGAQGIWEEKHRMGDRCKGP